MYRSYLTQNLLLHSTEEEFWSKKPEALKNLQTSILKCNCKKKRNNVFIQATYQMTNVSEGILTVEPEENISILWMNLEQVVIGSEYGVTYFEQEEANCFLLEG